MPKINPFKPNSPVPTGMFAGRIEEIKSLIQGLHQTSHNQGANFLITGERGIGKSSLMRLIQPMASGSITTLDDHAFKFITVSVSISDRMSLATFIKLIERHLKRELSKIEKIRGFMEDTWAFVQRIKIMDSGVDKSQREEEVDLLVDEFSYSLAQTCVRLVNPEKEEEKKDGIVFFVDEADNSCPELHLGYFFKAVTEQLQNHGCDSVMFVVAGLPETVDKLSASHESSVRLFTPLHIKELVPRDRKLVVDMGLDEANKINDEQTTISKEAVGMISTLSEGYPHYIQQFSYSAFEANDDGEISADDVSNGAFNEGGALDAIGQRYYKSAFHEKIQSDEYREVLTIMAESMNSWIKKSEIRHSFSGADQTLTDALSAMTTRKIILKNPSTKGEYRLQNRGFALWIKLFGQRGKQYNKSIQPTAKASAD